MNPINLTQSTDIELEGLKMVDHHHHHHHDNNPYPIDYSMVVIHDTKDCAVFPPINHENLSNQDTPQSPSPSPPSPSSSSSCLTSDADTCGGKVATSSSFDPHVWKGGDFTGWMSFGLQFLRSRVSSFRNGGAFRSIGWLPAAAIVFSCWALVMMAKKKRRRTSSPNETLLMNIIKEKDGRIAQLLNQIAQMNEILIARHKALAAKVVE